MCFQTLTELKNSLNINLFISFMFFLGLLYFILNSLPFRIVEWVEALLLFGGGGGGFPFFTYQFRFSVSWIPSSCLGLSIYKGRFHPLTELSVLVWLNRKGFVKEIWRCFESSFVWNAECFTTLISVLQFLTVLSLFDPLCWASVGPAIVLTCLQFWEMFLS